MMRRPSSASTSFPFSLNLTRLAMGNPFLEIFRELAHVGAGDDADRVAERADDLAGDIFADASEVRHILGRAFTVENTFEDFLGPERAFATGGALAAGFVRQESF